MKSKIYLFILFAFSIGVNAFAQTANWTFYDTTNTQLPTNAITAVAIDKANNKWFGTSYGGLVKYDGANWTVFNTSNSPLRSDYIYTIVVDDHNHLWIGTFDGLAYFDGVNLTMYGDYSTPFPFGSIEALTIDKAGDVWCYSSFCWGSALIKIHGNAITSYTTSNSGIPYSWIRDIAVDANNTVWMAGYDKGLIKFDGVNWTTYNPDNSGIPDSIASSVAIDKNGNIWVGMYKGLAKFDGSNWTVYNYGQVNEITIAENEDVWVGYDGGGIDKFDGTTWTNYATYNSDLPDDYVYDIKTDDHNAVWIATIHGGVAVLNENLSGIDDLNNSVGSSVSPNPFSNQIKVDLSNSEPTTIIIYDHLSRQILQQTFTNSSTINTERIPEGAYFYELRGSGRIIKTGKVIKQ